MVCDGGSGLPGRGWSNRDRGDKPGLEAYAKPSLMQDDRIESLSPRERDCLRLVLSTDAHKQIAHQLGISTNTVDGYLKSAIRKLGVSSSVRAAQILAAHEGGAPLPQSWGDHATPLPADEQPDLTMPSATAPQPPTPGASSRWLRLPARRAGRSGNDLTARQRLRESFQAMFISIASIGVLVAALTGLGILAHSWFGNR